MSELAVTTAGLRMVKTLAGKPPQTVAQLIRATGVTRTAVAEQLAELLAAGMVRRDTERLSGRGRPRHVYSATPRAIRSLFPGNQHLLVPAMFKAIQEIGGAVLLEQVIVGVASRMAEHYKGLVTAKTPRERLKQLAKALGKEGGVVESADRNGHVLMSKRVCLFFSMFEDERCVCQLDLKMMSEIIGCPLRQVACRHDGDHCCVFELVDAKEN